jgi:hypothetical protein
MAISISMVKSAEHQQHGLTTLEERGRLNAIAKEHADASPLKQLTNREVLRESKRRRMVRF